MALVERPFYCFNMLCTSLGANWTADRCYGIKNWVCQQSAHLLTVPTTSTTSTIPTTTEKGESLFMNMYRNVANIYFYET